jgi:hypothetical protein
MIEWDKTAGFDQINVTNPAGGNILTHDVQGLSSIETNLENYPPGVYIVHLRGLAKVVSGKLIILR